MQTEAHLRVIYHFFLDGAKITFGSLVVGLLVPSTIPTRFPFITFAGGIILTGVFLIIAQAALKKLHHPLTDL